MKNFKAALAGALILTMAAGALAPEAAQAGVLDDDEVSMDGDSDLVRSRFTYFELNTDAQDTDSSSDAGFYSSTIQDVVVFEKNILNDGTNLDDLIAPNTAISDVIKIADAGGVRPLFSTPNLAAESGVAPISLLNSDFADLTVRPCSPDCEGSYIDQSGNRKDFSIFAGGIANLFAQSQEDVIQYTVRLPISSNPADDVVANYFAPDTITEAQSKSGKEVLLSSDDLVNSLRGIREFSRDRIKGNIIIGFIESTDENGNRVGDDYGIEASMGFRVQTKVPEPATSATFLALGGLGVGAAFNRKKRKV